MSELTIPQRAQMTQTIHDVSAFLHGLFLDDPCYTGQITVHVKDGVAMDMDVNRKHRNFALKE